MRSSLSRRLTKQHHYHSSQISQKGNSRQHQAFHFIESGHPDGAFQQTDGFSRRGGPAKTFYEK